MFGAQGQMVDAKSSGSLAGRVQRLHRPPCSRRTCIGYRTVWFLAWSPFWADLFCLSISSRLLRRAFDGNLLCLTSRSAWSMSTRNSGKERSITLCAILLPALTGKMFRRTGTQLSDDKREFWALQDISFEVKRGEALGIIGHNGAGKSTALKILSRIMKPTKGRMVVNGRLSALIEVAAGFHPDLTGRENIFLNGTILGMTKREIDSKLDQIIAFSGIEEFIDTPVKRYSSGMFARLGFSVAAHVDPEC